MSEKRDYQVKEYQTKMTDSKKGIVICNWERGSGKTFSVFLKTLRKSGRYLYISSYSNTSLIREIEEEQGKSLKSCKVSRENIEIVNREDDTSNIYCYTENSLKTVRGLRNIDAVFFDECYPSRECMDDILKPMGIEKIFVLLSNDDIEYIDNRDSIKVEDFYDKQIKELMVEYAELPKDKNTTLTRENILKQIKTLQEMKRGN